MCTPRQILRAAPTCRRKTLATAEHQGLEAAAECPAEADDWAGAWQAFEQAVEVYEFLGGEADLNRVNAEFQADGIRRGPHSKHRWAVSGWNSLTDTELKVAAFGEAGCPTRRSRRGSCSPGGPS